MTGDCQASRESLSPHASISHKFATTLLLGSNHWALCARSYRSLSSVVLPMRQISHTGLLNTSHFAFVRISSRFPMSRSQIIPAKEHRKLYTLDPIPDLAVAPPLPSPDTAPESTPDPTTPIPNTSSAPVPSQAGPIRTTRRSRTKKATPLTTRVN